MASLRGTLRVPGDKSISHRALMFSALSQNEVLIRGLLDSGDVRSTRACLEALGVSITDVEGGVVVRGVGLRGFKKPVGPLDCGNSGTTIRLLMGILAGQDFPVTLIGDSSLSRRPMDRVAVPLVQMGARIEMTGGRFAPIHMHGLARLKSISHELPVASAQLKSALILAGLYAEKPNKLSGKTDSRDHTERMLRGFLDSNEGVREFEVPGDPSSAAFFIGGAVITPNSDVTIEGISLNPTRLGLVDALRRMGAEIEVRDSGRCGVEPVGSIRAKTSELRGIELIEGEIPRLIDELPLLAIIATQAQGMTRVTGAHELRVKESDRIEAIASGLRAIGAEIETFEDGYKVRGPQKLQGGKIDSHEDHRIAMSFAVASNITAGSVEIFGRECVAISYPGFYTDLKNITVDEPANAEGLRGN